MAYTYFFEKVNPCKINSLQILRGIAALIVVFVHEKVLLEQYNFSSTLGTVLGKFGIFGVDIFFVLSGFLMVITTINKAPGINTAKEFILSRLQRIVPMYWLMTTVLVVILFLFPSVFNKQKFVALNVISSYFFLPSLDYFGVINPVLYVGWTLIYEMFFYIIFSILLCFTRHYIIPTIAVIFLFLSFFGLFGSENIFIKTYSNTLIFEFIFGCGIAVYYLKSKTLSNWLAIAALFVSMALIWPLGSYISMLPRSIYLGIPAALMTVGCLCLEKNGAWPKFSLLQRIGDSSYSLYLSHIFVLPILGRLFLKKSSLHNVSPELILILILAICVIIGYLINKFIENPINQFLKNLSSLKNNRYLKLSNSDDELL